MPRRPMTFMSSADAILESMSIKEQVQVWDSFIPSLDY